MIEYKWANPEKIGVIKIEADRLTYIDGGPDLDAAIAWGPQEFSGPSDDDTPDPVAPDLTPGGVNAERARRILGGVVVMVPDHGAVALGGSDVDMRNLQGLAFAAQLRIAQGQGGTLTTFRDNDNVDHQLTQPQVLALWSAGAEYISDVFKASWALKDQDPIPADFAADQFWP